MTNSELDQARDWAESVSRVPATPRAKAAAELIKSLPDQLVDAEKLKVIIAGMCDSLQVEATTDFSKGFDNATMTWLRPLKDLIAPKLPTLADMTREEQEACVGMQADYSPLGEPVERVAIVGITDFGAILMSQNWGCSHREAGRITPLPGEQKLERPGSEVPEPPALPEGMRLADHEAYGRVVVSPKTDSDGDYRIFCSQDQTEYGDNWWYAHKSDLTFLDGEK